MLIIGISKSNDLGAQGTFKESKDLVLIDDVGSGGGDGGVANLGLARGEQLGLTELRIVTGGNRGTQGRRTRRGR